MKKAVFASLIGGLMMVGAVLWIGGQEEEKRYYEPRQNQAEDAGGSAAYWHRLRANQVTGKLEVADFLAAQEEVQKMAKAKKAALDLQWEEMGPSDIGGRSRAMIFDKDNPQIMFAAAVSGGIFKSTNGGRSWNPVDDKLNNLAVVSLHQSADGTIYAGTGEGLYYGNFGTGSGGILGAGMYKSTDGGNTFTQMPSTLPSGNGFEDWTAVGKLGSDPNNAQRLYAATAGGLKVSDDGGNTWQDAISGRRVSTDMTVTASGTVWVKQGVSIYKSTTGDPGSFTVMNDAVMVENNNRMRIAVAPTDENYVYVIATDESGRFFEAYQSTDGGATWRVIGTRNQLLNPHRNQGSFNNALAVDPKDKERIIVGGVEFWEWSESNGWLQIATLSRFSLNFYVHADNHNIMFQPDEPNTIWICNDGGIFKSTDNGNTYTMENKGYATIQFYGIDVSFNGELLGGTQDNSNIYIDPNGPLPTSGTRVFSGDGGEAEISHLRPQTAFIASQYGNLVRTFDQGENFSGFFSRDMLGTRGGEVGNSAAFAEFVTPFDLWENLRDPFATDSIRVGADTIKTSIGFGNGGTDYTGTVTKPQSSTKFAPATFVVRAGSQVVRSDANGVLSGTGTGSFDGNTGTFNVSFNNPTSLEILVEVVQRYDPMSPIVVESATSELPIRDTIEGGLEPGEAHFVIDPVQSMFAIGLTAYNNNSEPTNRYGGVWMTRDALRVPGEVEWWHIAELANNETPTCLSFSQDGDILLVGTNFGRVHRISNLNQARSEATADIDDDYSTGNPVPSTAVVENRVIFNSNGQAITSAVVDPEDSDRMIITLGNYGNNSYVFYTDRGTNPNLSNALFTNVTGNLPRFPVYDAVFNYNDPDGGEVLVGTDFGVFATEDINANTVTWAPENNGLANVPVFDLVQTRTVRYDLVTNQDFEGAIYAGTHGRGIFRTNSTVDYVSLPETPTQEERPQERGLEFFPNPAAERLSIKVSLNQRSDLSVSIRDLSGKLVKRISFNAVPAGTEQLNLPVSDLRNGTYLVSMTQGNQVQSGKLIIRR